MPKAPKASTLAELDAEVARADSLSVAATLERPDGPRLSVHVESSWSAAGVKGFELGLVSKDLVERDDSGAPVTETWRKRAPKLSTVIKAFAGAFPDAVLPPTRLSVSCRGSGLAPATVERLLLKGLAEALGKPLKADPRTEGPTGPEVADWPSLLRSGRDGLRKWGRLKADERKAVDLSGAVLGGLDLSGANFVGVKAKKATFAGSTLARTNLSGAQVDGADFAAADLREARLAHARAPEAVFRAAKLVGADLSDAMLFGCSFDGADLTGADLSDANLHRADLAGATLDAVTLEGASFDGRTAWPPGFTIPAEAIFAGRGTDPRLVGKGKSAVAADINGLMARLQNLIDPKRMKRTLDMLKSGKNQLFAEVEPTLVRGIVRSQKEEDLVYSCVLIEDGTYACCTPDLSPCFGLRGEPCKHILVLLIGLARAGRLDLPTVDRWVVAACDKKNHRWNKTTKNHVSDTLLRYKGVQAGEVDWRPTETIPEDFYAM
ncbi:MAG TPA: pentapeptide repeat-containing protein [Isosphaeraceae bacterium]|jgi:hypothetical protein|nr:pentapeptide repeat-containing protein [Isosphaeraceae bacterium]